MGELTQAHVRARIVDALAATEFDPVRAALQRLRVDDTRVVALLAGVNNFLVSQTPIQRLRDEVARAEGHEAGQAFARHALLVAAAQRVTDISLLPVGQDVKGMFLEEFMHFANPAANEPEWLEIGRPTFGSMCKVATLRRFPAGQFHFEISGLPRSTFLRVGGLGRARLIRAAWRLGGLTPLIVPHMPWRRQLALLERQQLVAYYRMAEAMQRQPRIRGLLAEAWFHSPDAPKVSPHLAFVNRVFLEWGGVVLDSGPAGESSGVFVAGERRRRLAEEGKFEPRLGLVIWPRREMLRWAAQYAGLREAV